MAYVASKVVSESAQLSRRTVDTAACSLKTYAQFCFAHRIWRECLLGLRIISCLGC